MDKGAPAAPAAKGSSDADGNANVKSKSTSESGAGAASSPNKSADEGKRNTTGQGAAAPAANLTSEQHTKITGIIRQHKVAPTQLNVSVRVGTRIPDGVRFYPLPREVFVIYPEWRGYEYIMVGNDILVIDPRTHQIVAVLESNTRCSDRGLFPVAFTASIQPCSASTSKLGLRPEQNI